MRSFVQEILELELRRRSRLPGTASEEEERNAEDDRATAACRERCPETLLVFGTNVGLRLCAS